MKGVCACAAVVCGAMLYLSVAAAVLAGHHARDAADVAALAAAQALPGGGIRGDDPCAVARRFAEANGATVAACRPTATSVTVTVAVTVGRAPSARSAEATSRAGLATPRR